MTVGGRDAAGESGKSTEAEVNTSSPTHPNETFFAGDGATAAPSAEGKNDGSGDILKTGKHAAVESIVDCQRKASAMVTADLLRLAESVETITAKGTWESLGSEKEIHLQNATHAQQRPRVQTQMSISREFLLQQHGARQHAFVLKEAGEDSRDLRGAPNPMYNLLRDDVEYGVQAVPRRENAQTQTYFARKVNAAVQAEPTMVDACIKHVAAPAQEAADMSAFLRSALPRTLHYLTQNYEVPIYTDDFARFKEDEVIAGTGDGAALIEKGNYAHAFTKSRRISSISWRSGRSKDDYVCVATVAPCTLQERLALNRRCDTGYSVVWEFSDPMHPRYILESPCEVQVLQFSKSNPSLIAGGAMNGQVFLWDLAEAEKTAFQMESMSNANSTNGGDTHGAGAPGPQANARRTAGKDSPELPPLQAEARGVALRKDGDVLVPHLQPIQSSRVEVSHRRPVHDLQWLPKNLECGFDGAQTVVESSKQFVTVSDDGSVCVWDTRTDYLPADRLRKLKHQVKGTGRSDGAAWIPLLRYQLSKPDGTGDVLGFRFSFDGLAADETPSYSMAVGGTDGEFATCKMIKQHERRPSIIVPTYGHTKETSFVRNVLSAHAGPVYCVQRHPVIGDVYLTCGDHSFKVWRVGMDYPLYQSPLMGAHVTCAAWSPMRSAIVFVGTSDGKIQVWDLLDRNNAPLLVHHMVQDAVTIINFKPPPHRPGSSFLQSLAIGTNLGSFHWYALPAILSRAPNGEARRFRVMLEREVQRVAYYTWRWEVRQREIDRYGASAPKMIVGSATINSRTGAGGGEVADLHGKSPRWDDDFNNPYVHDPQRDAEFLQAVEQFSKAEQLDMKGEATTGATHS